MGMHGVRDDGLDVPSWVGNEDHIMGVDTATRLVMRNFCKALQEDADMHDIHDDDNRMSNEFTNGFDDAIYQIRLISGLEVLEIDYDNNEIVDEKKKPVKKIVAKKTRNPEVFTVKDEKVFTVENEVSDETKTMGEVLTGDRYKEELKQTFVCDDCKKHYIGSDIELKPFGKNFGMVNPMISLKLVDATDGVIIGTSNTGSLNENHEYYTFVCPVCHATHLWGMSSVNPKKVFVVEYER